MLAKRPRVFAGAAVGTVALLLLAACSSSGSGDKSSSGGTPKGSVQLWTRSVLEPWVKQAAADFNAAHPGLTVKVTSITDDQIPTKEADAFRTGNVPDVIVADPGQALSSITSGNMLNLTKRLAAYPDQQAIAGPQLESAKYQGSYYGTPAFLDASVLLYNKKLFSQAGISGPPTNLDEMLADAKAVRALGKDIYGMSIGGSCAGCLAFTALPNFWTSTQGALIIGDDLNNQKAGVAGNAGLKSMLEMYQAAWPAGTIPKADQAETGATWNKDFQGGKIGLAPAGLGTYTTAPATVKSDIGVAPLPTAYGGVSTYLGGGNFGIPAKAKNPDGAWEFIQFALGKDEQARLPESGFAPVRSDLLQDAAFTAKYPYVLPSIQAAKTGFGLQTNYQAALFNDAAGPWLKMFQKAVFQGDVDGAITAGQAGFQKVLSGNGG